MFDTEKYTKFIDNKMFDLLYKEQIKKNLENKLAGIKPHEKKMKI